MFLTREILMNEVQAHLNEIVLSCKTAVRLIGCGESPEDFFYILDEGYGNRYVESGSGVYYSTSVGKPYFLKGYLPKEDYNELDILCTLNGAPKVEQLIWKEYTHE